MSWKCSTSVTEIVSISSIYPDLLPKAVDVDFVLKSMTCTLSLRTFLGYLFHTFLL